ncbi:histidine phosphatase family protein [Streptomyces sp. LP11]|uniref:Histidine phosphatase family protein n=1 Tax=Streptomyces pyxinicus TaxID=2970331 RepID=A0ABT2B4E7_9ACTN|nr:histidine phosphatase family protein [Streptomyces sp. LP11]MCS0603381.1 histidine phosphatase family protein [Streptomyces sp. LP11]
MAIRLTFLCAPGDYAALNPVLGDVPPSERGLREARAVRLPSYELALRTPSPRCERTADALGLPSVAEPALRDIDLGAWCGRTLDDIAATDPDGFTAWFTDPDAAPHGGESVRQLCRRVSAWLGALPPGTGHVLALTEAAVVRAAHIHALALPARGFWHFPAPPLSTVTLTRRDGRWDVGSAGPEERDADRLIRFPRPGTPERPRGRRRDDGPVRTASAG